METKYGILTGTTEVFFLPFVVFSRLRACFFLLFFLRMLCPLFLCVAFIHDFRFPYAL